MSLKHTPLSLPKAAGSRAVDIALSASAEDLRAALLEQKAVSQEQALRLLYDWSYWARAEQMPPPGDWRVWLLRPGRGFGKTRAGAQWVIQRAYEGKGPITLIGQSAFDTREVMIKGPSGIIPNSPPWFKPVYESSKRLLTWPNGIVGYCFSGDEPGQQKGPNVQSGWLDEFCLVGRMLISAENGPILIGQIRPGMRVWTRRGLRPVVHWAMTNPDAEVYDVLMSNGQTITGTFNHPVWVRGVGFVPLGRLRQGDRLLCIAKDRGFGGTEECGTETSGGTTAPGRVGRGNPILDYTEKYGRFHAGSSPKEWIFTTLAKIHQIITSTTWRFLHTPTTNDYIRPLVGVCFGAKSSTPSKAGKCGREEKKDPTTNSASTAERHTRQSPVKSEPVFVQRNAAPNTITSERRKRCARLLGFAKTAEESFKAQTTKLKRALCLVGPPPGVKDKGPRKPSSTRNALSAAPPSSPEATSLPIAPMTVRRHQEICVIRVSLSPIRQPVYNIEIADCPEYFANGILTHNCKFRYAEETWNQFSFTLRYGDDPRVVITTTPRPLRVFKQVMDDPRTFVQGGTLYDNRANLNPDFVEDITRRFGGTRLGREMIMGELLDDTPGAIFTLKVIDEHRVRPAQVPSMRQIVVGVDPSAADYDPDNEDKRGAECGIVVAGVGGHEDHGYVLHDASDMMSPHDWAEKVVAMYYKFNANYVVAEKNNGGGMVRETIHAIDDRVPVMLVWASQGKEPRAEPVSLLYEQGRVHHVGSLPDLEDQMSSFVPRDKRRQPSDRMDALVWAIKHLMLGDDKMPHYDPTRHVMPRWRRPDQ